MPSLSNQFFNDNSEKFSNESSQSEIVTTAEITTAAISFTSTETKTTVAIAATEAPTEKSGKTYIDAIPLTIGEAYER